MNVCRHCKKEIEPSVRQIAKGDYVCDQCRNQYNREYRAKRKAEGNPLKQSVMPQGYRKAYAAAYNKAYSAIYFQKEENRLRRNARMAAYRKAHGTRAHHLARDKTNREINSGRLVRQPCEVCGSVPTHAHHDDYEKPLDVRWLCRSHHVEHHAKANHKKESA